MKKIFNKLKLLTHECNRCGYIWTSKDKEPKTCANPKCRSKYWNKERVRPLEELSAIFQKGKTKRENTFRMFNPWWHSKNWYELDPKLMEWTNSQIKWVPPRINEFDVDNDIVYSLRGARQIGKTLLMKLMIRKLLEEKKFRKENIFYYAFDDVPEEDRFTDILKNYLTSYSKRTAKERCILFLDEVTKTDHWEDGIKGLVDMGLLRNCTIIVSSSYAYDIEQSLESLAGRRGETDDSIDKIMLPMNFSQYVILHDPNLAHNIQKCFIDEASKIKTFKNMLDLQIDSELQNLMQYLPNLNQYLQSYMLTGGIPKVVNNYITNASISESNYRIYLDTIVREFPKWGIREYQHNEIMPTILKNLGQNISIPMLESRTTIEKREINSYLNTLSHLFVIFHLENFESKIRIDLEKKKRIYFRDPFYFHIFNSITNPQSNFEISREFVSKVDNQEKIIEGIIGDHLGRLMFKLSSKTQTFDLSHFLFHWQGKEKNEIVDFVYFDGKIGIPIDVKIASNDNNDMVDGINCYQKHTDVKQGVIICGDELRAEDTYIKIPASIFLMLI